MKNNKEILEQKKNFMETTKQSPQALLEKKMAKYHDSILDYKPEEETGVNTDSECEESGCDEDSSEEEELDFPRESA